MTPLRLSRTSARESARTASCNLALGVGLPEVHTGDGSQSRSAEPVPPDGARCAHPRSSAIIPAVMASGQTAPGSISLRFSPSADRCFRLAELALANSPPPPAWEDAVLLARAAVRSSGTGQRALQLILGPNSTWQSQHSSWSQAQLCGTLASPNLLLRCCAGSYRRGLNSRAPAGTSLRRSWSTADDPTCIRSWRPLSTSVATRQKGLSPCSALGRVGLHRHHGSGPPCWVELVAASNRLQRATPSGWCRGGDSLQPVPGQAAGRQPCPLAPTQTSRTPARGRDKALECPALCEWAQAGLPQQQDLRPWTHTGERARLNASGGGGCSARVRAADRTLASGCAAT